MSIDVVSPLKNLICVSLFALISSCSEQPNQYAVLEHDGVVWKIQFLDSLENNPDSTIVRALISVTNTDQVLTSVDLTCFELSVIGEETSELYVDRAAHVLPNRVDLDSFKRQVEVYWIVRDNTEPVALEATSVSLKDGCALLS